MLPGVLGIGATPSLLLTDGLGGLGAPGAPGSRIVHIEQILRHSERRPGNLSPGIGRPTFTRVESTPVVFPAKVK